MALLTIGDFYHRETVGMQRHLKCSTSCDAGEGLPNLRFCAHQLRQTKGELGKGVRSGPTKPMVPLPVSFGINTGIRSSESSPPCPFSHTIFRQTERKVQSCCKKRPESRRSYRTVSKTGRPMMGNKYGANMSKVSGFDGLQRLVIRWTFCLSHKAPHL